MDRIPFLEAVSEPRMLKKRFDELTHAQQMVLLATYGCPLDNRKQDDRGWTQLDYWWASQGYVTYDENGFIKKVHPPPGAVYIPQDYNETWITAGIRGGKGECAAFISGYEAVFGGHDDYFREGQPAFILQIAQDLTLARESLHRIRALLDSVPFLTTPYHGQWSGTSGERIGRQTTDIIQLWNGMKIKCCPPTVKAVRGYDGAAAVMDEVGVWPTADDASNVDEQVYTQVKSRFAQFPHSRLVALSSPWIMSGMLYRNHKIGTKGQNVYCRSCNKGNAVLGCPNCTWARRAYKRFLGVHLTTAAFGGIDGVTKGTDEYLTAAEEFLTSYRLLKPEEFRRECLAEFQPATGSFLPIKRVEECVDTGTFERAPIVLRQGEKIPDYLPMYVAAMDPAFRHDSFAFGIAHADEHGKVIIDVMREWVPEPDQPLKPKEIIDQITPLMTAYDCVSAATDQHEFEALESIILDAGWGVERVPFSSQSKLNIYGNLKQLVLQGRISLLDHENATHQLKALQKRLSDTGSVAIAAPNNQRDDLATVVALLAKCAVSLLPTETPPADRPLTVQEMCQQTIDRKHHLRDSFE
jgi:hypothetical protein